MATHPKATLPVTTAGTKGIDIDALVNEYAPLGRQQRQIARRRKLGVVVVVPVVALLLLAGFEGARRWSASAPAVNDSAVAKQIAELTTLKGEINAERHEWQQERQAFQQQSSQLLQQLAEINAQRQSLDEQRQAFQTRQDELASALAKLEDQNRQLDQDRLAATRQGPNIDKQVAELNRRAQLLDEQREQFRSQSGKVTQELKALDAQRHELEGQQQALELQRRELQSLMERYENASQPADLNMSKGPQTSGALTPPPRPAEDAPVPMMAANAVTNEVLGEMRGGLRVDGLDISFGLTQSATINGVEQFSNSMYIDSLREPGSGNVDNSGAFASAGFG